MADPLASVNEAELAGYVDAGIWDLEEWLARNAEQAKSVERFLRELWGDHFQ